MKKVDKFFSIHIMTVVRIMGLFISKVANGHFH